MQNHVLGDFGVAVTTRERDGTRLTEPGHILGTPHYMSPEQASGEVRLDGRSDLYSLGCVLFELITGRPPFVGRTAETVLRQHLSAAPPNLRDFRDRVPANLESIVAHCLAKNPADRYANASELLWDLRAVEIESPGLRTTCASGRSSLLSSRRMIVLAALTAATLALALTAAGLWTRSPRSVEATAIAVFPFGIRGGSEAEYLQEGVVDLLSTALDGAGELRTVDPHALLSLVRREEEAAVTPEAGHAMSGKLGAGRYVLGSVLQSGNQIRMDATVYEVGRQPRELGRATVVGADDRIFPLVDSLASQILALCSPKDTPRLAMIATRSTSSLEALKAHLVGERALREGRFDLAAESFERATSRDTLFALAWYRLAWAQQWRNDFDRAHVAADRATLLHERLATRDQALLVALQAYLRGESERAESLYRELASEHPDDVEAWYMLGETQIHHYPFRGLDVRRSRDAFARALELDPRLWGARYHLAEIASLDGRTAAIDSLLAQGLSLGIEPHEALWFRTLGAVATQDTMTIGTVIRELDLASDEALQLALVQVEFFTPEFETAVRIGHLLVDEKRAAPARRAGHVHLAYLSAARGRIREAFDHLRVAESIDPGSVWVDRGLMVLAPAFEGERDSLQASYAAMEREARLAAAGVARASDARARILAITRAYLLAMTAARLERPDAARQWVDELAGVDTAAGPGRLAGVLAASAASEIQRTGETQARAGVVSRSVHPRFWMMSAPWGIQQHILARHQRAEAHFALEQWAEAAGWYAGAHFYAPYGLAFVPNAEIRLGEIFERLGDGERARKHFARFVALWRECDPELVPLRSEIETRLARLDERHSRGRDQEQEATQP